MGSVNFRRAADLFMGDRSELAAALQVSEEDVATYTNQPDQVPSDVQEKMSQVLVDRGRGMIRVGEMLMEELETE